MSEVLLRSLDRKMSMLIRLLALDVAKGRPLIEQIDLLHNAGLNPSEIATLLGKTPNNIRVQLHSLKKRKITKSSEVIYR
jgi:hypothetical protein